jgi:arginyl-tRNA synthetase
MIGNLEIQVQEKLEETLSNMGYDGYDIGLDIIPESSDSVLASSVCFQIAQDNNRNPSEVAQEVCGNIENPENIKNIKSTGPYINFYADDEWYESLVSKSKDDDFGSNLVDGKDISVEHTSVNPTGPLHIGRVRNSILGDSLANILSFYGHSVTRDYYVNDTGLQVAVLTWAYENYSETELSEPEYKGRHYDLVRYYQKAFENLDTDLIKQIQQGDIPVSADYKETDVVKILKGLENDNNDIKERVTQVVSDMLHAQLQSLENIGISFDNFTRESKYMGSSKLNNLLIQLKNLGNTDKSDGAWSLEFDDIDKPFIFERSNGTTLYGTRDIAYHIGKIENHDEAILVLGEDQELHIKSVKKALDCLGYEGELVNVVHHAFVRTPEGGMSARQGEGDFIEDVLESATSKALDIMNDRDITNKEDVAEDIATGALRYNILSKGRLQLSTFDAENAVSVQSQTGPGIQYTYARLFGILNNTDVAELGFSSEYVEKDVSIRLLDKISYFPYVLSEVCDDMEPHNLTVYMKDLHEEIKSFYQECPVKNAESKKIRSNRLHIVMCAINVLGTSMDLLGIPKIEEM